MIPEAVVLDLFAGSGAIGIEALSRGAEKAVFVDVHRDSIQCIKENIALFQLNQKAEVWQGDVFAMLERLAKKGASFDLIYADPPYEAQSFLEGKPISFSDRVVKIIDSSKLLNPGGLLFIEDAINSAAFSSPLQSLEFIKIRSFGRSALHQFRKSACDSD